MGPALFAIVLVALSGPDGQVIFVNPAEVVSIRSPRALHSEHFAPGIRCVLQTVDGKAIGVADDCDVVRAGIGAKP